jgi:hypothetical protein
MKTLLNLCFVLVFLVSSCVISEQDLNPKTISVNKMNEKQVRLAKQLIEESKTRELTPLELALVMKVDTSSHTKKLGSKGQK